MFLERGKSKERYYLYLREYKVRDHYSSNRITLYRFGRLEKALEEMYKWKKDFYEFPRELLDLGCTKKDLLNWIKAIETGVHKTGRKVNTVRKTAM